ncbi:GTP 3',8-cyclase [Desulforhabdus amnigena]|uniref:GTP 3',8-cyclase n=2 Tax=Desulforhabdus amnigena TaxID=40218 RepID=A0A9W6FT55_9BACT|nr:GTP 3',8-cyclase [Desulforhabdus amnigena]
MDSFGRTISYLRLSITDRCNLRCWYCKPEGSPASLAHADILTYEELHRLTRIAVNLGIRKVRVTGGEPLVRRGAAAFLSELAQIQGLEDVSLTTNGVLLKQHLEQIQESGIHRINISLDTLKQEKYHRITGTDAFNDVREAIELARRMRFHPIKINMVVIKGFNDDEVADMALLARSYPYYVRFIEYMPVGRNQADTIIYTVPISTIRNRIEAGIGKLMPVPRGINDGPAERYRFEGGAGEIGFIGSMSNHFCDSCNRLRLTANGYLRPCLLSNTQQDIKGPMRDGATDAELEGIFLKTVHQKPSQHVFSLGTEAVIWDQMSAIGG